MASVKAWSTKEEVLKDISRASGRSIPKREEIESGLVIGDVPPPVLEEDADAQLEMMFGHKKIIQTEEQAPDLIGIQNMLRMVDGTADDTDSYRTDGERSTQCSNHVFAISKNRQLNPNVEEFVPKACSSSNYIKTEPTVGAEIKVENIAQTLRHKISNAAKSDSYELKREKNVAIATLLKLYANSDNTDRPMVKLVTPEYFETNSKDTKPEENRQKSVETISPSNSNCCNSSTPSKSPHLNLDPEVKKSIDKVNNWLLEPSKRKTQAVCLGPIEFKRKNVPAVKSPVSSVGSKPSQDDSRKYQPSLYATELAKKYEEKNRAVQESRQPVTWTNLEEKLREKDLKLRNCSEGKSSESSSSVQ